MIDLIEEYRNGKFGTAEELHSYLSNNYSNDGKMLTRWKTGRFISIQEKAEEFLQDFLKNKYLEDGNIVSTEDMATWVKEKYFVKLGATANIYFRKVREPLFVSPKFKDVLYCFSTWLGKISLYWDDIKDFVVAVEYALCYDILLDIKRCVRYAPWIVSHEENRGRRKGLLEYSNVNKMHTYLFTDYVSFTDALFTNLSLEELKWYIETYINETSVKIKGISHNRRNKSSRDELLLLYWVKLKKNNIADDKKVLSCVCDYFDLSEGTVSKVCTCFKQYMKYKLKYESDNMPLY